MEILEVEGPGALSAGKHQPTLIGGGQEAAGTVDGLGKGKRNIGDVIGGGVADFSAHVDFLGTEGHDFDINLGPLEHLVQLFGQEFPHLDDREPAEPEAAEVRKEKVAFFVHHHARGGVGAVLAQRQRDFRMVPHGHQQDVLGTHLVVFDLGDQ